MSVASLPTRADAAVAVCAGLRPTFTCPTSVTLRRYHTAHGVCFTGSTHGNRQSPRSTRTTGGGSPAARAPDCRIYYTTRQSVLRRAVRACVH